MSYQCISIDEAHHLINSNDVTLLDIRDAISFTQGSMPGAVHVTNNNVDDIAANADKTKPVIVCCYHGNSSKGAAEYFYHLGFEKAYSMDGGFEEWKTKY